MILSILQHTPVWVFAIFAGLLYLGIQRSRPNDTPVGRLLILPVAMAAFSLFGLVQAFGAGVVVSGAWLIAYALVLLVGWTIPPLDSVQYSSATRTIRVPGSWLPLALMMTIFFLRYAVAVALSIKPALHDEVVVAAGIAALYGLSSGCFAARTLVTWRSAFRQRVGHVGVAART